MTKEEYRKMRINQLGADYTKHNTSKPGWDKCIALECGDWPEFRRETSEKVTLEMLLKCEYSPAEIVAVLKERFPDKDNNGRPKRIFSIFSKGKCRNITEYCNGKILGLKWDKYKFFAKDSNELKTISCLDPLRFQSRGQ